MKYKILVTGNNTTLIDDFFLHMNEDFEVLTTSTRYEDISMHIQYFSPDAFVYCIYNEAIETFNKMVRLKFLLTEAKIPFILIGSKEDCDEFDRTAVNISDLVLVRPMSANTIRTKIIKYLDNMPKIVETPAQDEEDEEDDIDISDIDIDALLNSTPLDDNATVTNAAPPQPVVAPLKPNVAPLKPNVAPTAPKSASVDEVLKNAQVKSVASSPAKKVKGRKHILVVDDNPLMLKVIKEHLHDEYDVATAISGKIALRFLENRDVDLILLDYEMPEQDGTVVLEKIRKMERAKNTPVIFLTGISDRKKIQKVLVLKPQGYLLKPIDREKLLIEIKKYLG